MRPGFVACGFAWSDGWGDHECHSEKGHTAGSHYCACDAYTRAEAA